MAELKVKAVGEEEPTAQKVTKETLENKIDLRPSESEDHATEEQVTETDKEQVEEQVPVEEVKESEDSTSSEQDQEEAREDLSSKEDQYVQENIEQIELTPEIEALLKYQKETGRSLGDYLELSKDYKSMEDSELLRNYLKQTKPHYDDDDISYYIESSFASTEDDSESESRSKKLKFKEELYNAKEYFETQKEKYYEPLESSSADVPKEYQEAFSFYSDYTKSLEKQDLEVKKRGEFFKNETDKFFGQVESFEFDLGDKKASYKLNDKDSLKKQTSDINGFVNRFVDKNGLIKDPAGYHRSMAMANNPDAFAKHFYEMGKAEAVGDLVKDTKNIDMSVKQNVGSSEDGKVKFRAVSDDGGSKLRIKKKIKTTLKF